MKVKPKTIKSWDDIQKMRPILRSTVWVKTRRKTIRALVVNQFPLTSVS